MSKNMNRHHHCSNNAFLQKPLGVCLSIFQKFAYSVKFDIKKFFSYFYGFINRNEQPHIILRIPFLLIRRYYLVISDSKQERLGKQKWFAEAVAKYRSEDNCLDQMLRSYQKALEDPQNELVHLYEIRDALSAQFKNKKNTIKHLGITNKDWDIIGDIANSRPLEQGRLRGKSVGNLRPAEKNELETARKAASNLVEKYLTYIETK